jgi:hypothetical protein
VRFLAAGQGLVRSCVEEHCRGTLLASPGRIGGGVSILSPGIKESVRVEQELSFTLTVEEFTEGNYDWIIPCSSNQLI